MRVRPPVLIVVFVIALTSGSAFSQDYPAGPIRIATGAAGGPSDFTARLIAQGISGHLGQLMVVGNRASIIAIETVAKAVPDPFAESTC